MNANGCPVKSRPFVRCAQLSLILLHGAANLEAQPVSHDLARTPYEVPVDEYERLMPVDADFMLRGYCFAHSSIEDTISAGGYAVTTNSPYRITTEMRIPAGKLSLVALPGARTKFGGDRRGMRVLLANTTDTVADSDSV